MKSNIGHTQAASGMAGIIKMVQAMRHATLPKSLHAEAASPLVDWSAGAVELLAQARVWEDADGRPRRAGVSSFGVSGTNAHVILEEPRSRRSPREPAPLVAESGAATVVPWLLSGALGSGAARPGRQLLTASGASSNADPVDMAHSLLTVRAVLE